jgi:hypothetical protein
MVPYINESIASVENQTIYDWQRLVVKTLLLSWLEIVFEYVIIQLN